MRAWTARDYLLDAAEQQAEANDAINQEIRDQRNADRHLIHDDRVPTRAELAADDRERNAR